MRVLTLNLWDLPYIAKDISCRMSAIRERIRGNSVNYLDYDIIMFQELWDIEEFERFQKAFVSIYPYSFHFYRPNTLMGSGLAIFSRYPLRNERFIPFKINGYPWRILDGDYFSDKGIGYALLEHPTMGRIDLFTTHLVADYSKKANGDDDRYLLHRISQVIQIIKATLSSSNPMILGGDLNFPPDSLPFSLLMNYVQKLKRVEPLFATSDLQDNSYTSNPLMTPKIIDHIMFSSEFYQDGLSIPDFEGKHEISSGSKMFSFSDHSGINCKFTLSKPYFNEYTDKSKTFGILRIGEFESLLEQERKSISSVGFATIFSMISSSVIFILFLKIQQDLQNRQSTSSYMPLNGGGASRRKDKTLYRALVILAFCSYIIFNIAILRWNKFEGEIIDEIDQFIYM